MDASDPGARTLTVAVVDTEPQTRNRYIAVSVARAFGRHPAVRRVLTPGYDDLVESCRRCHVDLLVAIGGSGAFAVPLLRAAGLAGTSVLWTSEDPYELPANLELARHFDFTFSNDAASVARYGDRARPLAYAASLDFHDVTSQDVTSQDVASRDVASRGVAGRPGADDSLYDLLFVGTAWPNRVEILDDLVTRLPAGSRLKFGLSGNRFLADWQLGSPDLLTEFRVAPRDFARLALRSKIVLTLDRDFSATGGAASTAASPPPRLFEIGLVGTPQVYLASSPLAPAYYAAGEEVAVVSTVEQAADEIRRLLDDAPARAAMGANARARTRREHLYDHRVGTILDETGILDGGGAAPGRAAKTDRFQAPRGTGRRRPRILSVVHNLAGIGSFGGVELYQETLAAALPDYDFVSLAASGSRLAITVVDGSRRRLEAYPVEAMPDGLAFDANRDTIFHDALVRHEIDLVHYQHLMYHSLGYPMIGAMLGVPQVATAHDFFLACSRFNLIGPAGHFCGIDSDRTGLCDLCLEATERIPEGSQARRREIMREVLARFDRLLFNTPSSLELMRRIYPALDPARTAIVGMTGAPATLAALSRAASARPTGRARPLQVAVIGNVSIPKGAEDLIPIMARLRREPIVFHLHGRIDSSYVEAIGALPNVVAHGPYDGADLPVRLAGQQVSLHVSVWPETYCISLDEARAAGLVPIVLGIGALAERVVDGVDGYVVDPAHPEDLVGLLARIVADPAELDRIGRRSIDAGAILADHVAAVRAVFEREMAAKPVVPMAVLPHVRRVPTRADLALRFGSASWTSPHLDLDAPAEARDDMLVAAEATLAPVAPQDAHAPIDIRLPQAGLAGARLRVDDLVFAAGSGRTARLGVLPDAVLALSATPDTVALVRAFGLRGYGFRRLAVASTSDDGSSVALARADLSGLEAGRYDLLVELADTGLETAWHDTDVDLTIGRISETAPLRPERSQPALAAPLIPALPRRTWLDRMISRRPSEARGHLDEFAGPHDPKVSRRLARSDILPLRVGGWLIPRDGTAAFESIAVRLVGSEWTARIETIMTERADVAATLQAPHLIRNGFVSIVELGPLPSGSYRIELVGVRADGREAVMPAGRVTLA